MHLLPLKHIAIIALLVLFQGLCFPQQASAQSLEQHAAEQLKSAGFEEIRVIRQGPEVVCTIERGLYRSPDADLRRASQLLKDVFGESTPLRIILLEQRQPMYQLKLGATNQEEPMNNSINRIGFPEAVELTWADRNDFRPVKKEPVKRPVYSGVSLVLYPQLTLQNMYFDHIYEKQLNLAPALYYSGWQGMLITAQVIFPIVNELNSPENSIRPGFVTLSQRIILPHRNQLKLTAGNFNRNRYGLDVKWRKYFGNSRWSLSANMGLTGKSFFYNNYWNQGSLTQLSWNVKASYYLPVYQLRADLLGGQFLAGDKGFRMDVYRHFGEITIGVYATYTGHNPNGGFHFAFPLDPFKRNHPHRVRVMLPAYFDMEYSARNEFVYNRYYETSPDENRSGQDINTQHLKSQFNNP